jgi:hypothetical protein
VIPTFLERQKGPKDQNPKDPVQAVAEPFPNLLSSVSLQHQMLARVDLYHDLKCVE